MLICSRGCNRRFSSADAPSIALPTKSYNVTEGNDMDLSCRSDSRPPPVVTWFKTGGLSHSAYPHDQHLTISNANRTEAGTYTCTAANGIGKKATAAMDVIVFCEFQRRQFLKLMSNDLNVTLGASKRLRCPKDFFSYKRACALRRE